MNSNITANSISPTNLIAGELKYGDNRFRPIYGNKVYNIIFNIHKVPGKYMFKIEYLPISNKEIKLVPFLTTTRLGDIIDLLLLWKNKVEKRPELLYNREEELSKSILSDNILNSLTEITQNSNKIKDSKDANEQAMLSIPYFESYEKVHFLGASSKKDLEELDTNTENFIYQYDEIAKEVKKKTSSEKVAILRMIDDYIDRNKDLDSGMANLIFPIFEDLLIKEIIKDKNKDLGSKASDFLRLANTFKNLTNKSKFQKAIEISKIKEINNACEMLEMKVQKNLEKQENTMAGVERTYKKKRLENGYLITDKAERNGETYTDEELTDILLELENACTQRGPNKFNAKENGDLLIDLALKYKREPGAIYSIFKLAYSETPFFGLDTKNDFKYTLKILILRNKLKLNIYGRSNKWFYDRYGEELESGRGNEKTIQRILREFVKMGVKE